MITEEQEEAVRRLHSRSADGSKTYEEFRERFVKKGEFIGAQWCGMYVGIEPDGHSHT